MADRSLDQDLETRVEALGYELVELERTGTRTRPILRVRIDRPDSTPGQGVTVSDCTRVSRDLETYLEERGDVAERYVLEVSSPGVERPLNRPRDFTRFAGQQISVKGHAPLAGKAKRLEGELIELQGTGGDERVRMKLKDGEIVEIPRTEITRAQLVFRWNDRAG